VWNICEILLLQPAVLFIIYMYTYEIVLLIQLIGQFFNTYIFQSIQKPANKKSSYSSRTRQQNSLWIMWVNKKWY